MQRHRSGSLEQLPVAGFLPDCYFGLDIVIPVQMREVQTFIGVQVKRPAKKIAEIMMKCFLQDHLVTRWCVSDYRDDRRASDNQLMIHFQLNGSLPSLGHLPPIIKCIASIGH